MNQISVLFLICLVFISVKSDAIDKGVRQAGLGELLDMTIPGVTVRQCSCEEQSSCVEEIKNQVFDCGDDCFPKFKKLTENTENLKQCIDSKEIVFNNFVKCVQTNLHACQCIDSKEIVFNNFVKCVQTNLHACVQTKNGPKIPKHDLKKMFDFAVSKVTTQRDSLLKNAAVKPIHDVVETALDFGGCVKDCFMEKQKNGFCFDKKNCQPLITEKKAISTLKKCIRDLDWKKEAGELCDCSVKAGVSSLEKYCPMLRIMGQGRKGHKK
uniref:Uncharacterized protein n=1 Tax=Panagrolaimus sp. JU765 TaxID=591449 RepID=A0AC34QDI6_9BILA